MVYGLDGPVTGGILTVPRKINGYTVREIGRNAFRDRPGLREVVLPEGVRRPENAFDWFRAYIVK